MTYAESIADRTTIPQTGNGAFRQGETNSSPVGDFHQGVDPLNSYAYGSKGGGYTVRAGDTLASIAKQLYGDSSLWYKIAQANGMTGQAALTEGQSLRLPNQRTGQHL